MAATDDHSRPRTAATEARIVPLAAPIFDVEHHRDVRFVYAMAEPTALRADARRNRDGLVTAVFTERMAENAASVETALHQPDPWEAFAGYVRQTCRAQAADKGLADLFAIGHRDEELRALRARAYDGFLALIDNAKASGDLRKDFTAEDIALLLMANAGVIERAGTAAVAASERFVGFALDGFRAEGATDAPPAPSPRSLVMALRRQRR